MIYYAHIVERRSGADSAEYRKAQRNWLFVPFFGLFVAIMGVRRHESEEYSFEISTVVS